MKTKLKPGQILSLLFLFALFTIGIVSAASTTNPSIPISMTYQSNSTNSYSTNGTQQNLTRGYISTYHINESQPTIKWTAIVGNITAEFALQDSSGYAIYDWDIVTTQGELYASKELRAPYWENLGCANGSLIRAESCLWNHSAGDSYNMTRLSNDSLTGYPIPNDEDSFQSTWNAAIGHTIFYAGENVITGCSGIRLMQNNSESSSDWEEVILHDGQSEHITGDNYEYDIIYTVLIENDTYGFDFNTYDFQMMLPQSGLEGAQTVIPFYFYIELI